MTSLMEKEYNLEFQLLIKRLQQVQFIAFTADGWESRNSNRSFIRFVLNSKSIYPLFLV